jgi:hypothetical protein
MAASCTYAQRSEATVFNKTLAVGSRERRRSLTEQSFAKISEHKSTFCLEWRKSHKTWVI